MRASTRYCNRFVSMSLILIVITAICFSSQMSYADESVTPWYASGVSEADEWGILPNDYENLSLKQPITRGEFAEAIVLAYIRTTGALPETWSQNVFNDESNAFADVAYELELVSGYPNGDFNPDGPIKREEMFVMIQKLIYKIQKVDAIEPTSIEEINGQFSDADSLSVWAKEASALLVSRNIVNGTDEKKLAPKQVTSRAQAFIILKNAVNTIAFAPNTNPETELAIDKINALVYTETDADADTIAENAAVTAPEEPVSRGGRRGDGEYRTLEDMYTPAELMVKLGNNAIKFASIFGSADAQRYQTAEEAQLHLVTVTVEVWSLGNNGMKIPSTRNITVNKGIANTVVQVFKEIYEGPEQFPIKDIGGYAWRSSETSEHRLGLAIDINATENYMIRPDGSIVAGSFWKPGESPYSISPTGDVVNAFKKYGFSWGGDAWPTSNDYMHFSFLGW